ncbi:ionotropic receptor 75a-like [Phymastichus coffea]|uniref:ionotropic receptor 75a-like n=1 Tax=Phymastichus coffea TaxID=108790 RepID=UPI00273BBEAF|nr:ionotropic receptor 75a-like [Phymastichus coffea]
MKLEFLIILCMLEKIKSNEQSNFLIDYFVFKNVPYVVGFSCYNIEEKLTLSKRFNRLGIRTSFHYLDSGSQMFYLINSKYWKIGVFIDISCIGGNKLHSFLSKVAAWQLYGEMHSWLIFTDRDLSKAIAQLDESGFGMSTDLVVAVPILGGYELFDVYNPWKEGDAKINITRLGSWIQSTNLNITLNQSKFRRRCNLHRITMKSSFFGSKYRPKNMSLEEYLQDYSTLSKDGLSKFGYIMLKHLSEMYNFTFRFGEVETWLPGDSIGPLSRALLDNEIQITGSPVVITHERLRLTKFVYPAWPFRTCFIFRNPQAKDIKIGEVLHPFADESWYATLIALMTIFIILAVSLKQESYVISANILSNAFLITVGCMCQQSTHYNLNRISTRIVFIHLMIFSILTYTYYSASIVSTRLNEPILKINDSLNELGKLELKMASEPMIYFNFIFNRVTAWDKKVFVEDKWMKIPEPEQFMYPEKAMTLVRKGGFAYHTHPDVSYPIIDKTFTFREICELMEVHPVAPAYSTLSVNYNSTFVELTKIGLSRMTEVGIRSRQVERWTSKKPICRQDVINVSSTDIYEFAPHLILLVIGMIMAATIFVCEFVFDNYWNYQDRCENKYCGSSKSNISTTHSLLLMLCNTNK